MSLIDEPFHRANYRFRRRAYEQWHRVQSKQHILRSQVGFHDAMTSRPRACNGCSNYHGIAYGTMRSQRSTLICAMHPYGWHDPHPCPDWIGELKER